MAQAQQQTQWDHTASLMCLIINACKQSGQRQVTPEQLNPYRVTQQQRKPFEHLKERLTYGNGRSNQSG